MNSALWFINGMEHLNDPLIDTRNYTHTVNTQAEAPEQHKNLKLYSEAHP